MADNSEKIAGFIGMAILSAFLLGLAESIGHIPFWIIVVSVLCLAWYGYYDECIRKPKENNGSA